MTSENVKESEGSFGVDTEWLRDWLGDELPW